MPRVMQIGDVPDDVHDALTRAARDRGLSLNEYLVGELMHLAKRAQVVRHNALVVRQTQAQVQGDLDRDTVLEILREGRGG